MDLRKLYNSDWFLKSVFAVCLFVILVIAGMTYRHIQTLSHSTDQVVHTYKVNVELEQIISYLKDAETGQRGYFITGDSLYLDPYLINREKINNTFASLKELTKNNKEQQENLKILNQTIEERLLNLSQAYSAFLKRDINTPEFKNLFLRGKTTMDDIRAQVSSMIAIEDKRLKGRRDAYKDDLRFTPIFLFSFVLLTLILLLIAYAKIQADVSKLKSANAKLEIFKESTNQSEIISNHGNWVWNIEDNFFEYSDNMYRMLGEEPQSFDSTIENFMTYVHPDDVVKLQEQVDQMMVDENLPFINYRIIRKNGDIRYFKARGQKVSGDDYRKRVIGTIVDVTDEIQNLVVLEERNFELERNNEELSAFNHVASHDLQEPLRKIQTFLSRLEEKEKDNLSDAGKKYMQRIVTAAARMRLLIDDLLQYSRTNKSDQAIENVDLNEIFENAKLHLSEEIKDKKALITSEDLPNGLVIPFQMQQLFTNLLGNALKYSKEDVTPHIKVAYSKIKSTDDSRLDPKKSDYYHKIEFKDNGIGFEQEYADKIFELFNRLHNRDAYSGTGIGLSICKKIVENHKGIIYATGIPNQGSTFTILLPHNKK